MSIYNDFRQISDDIWDFCEWLNEMKRELRGADAYPDEPEIEIEESEDKEND